MKTNDIPTAALNLLNLIYKQIEQVTQDGADKNAFFIHCKDGTTVRLTAEILNKGGADTVH